MKDKQIKKSQQGTILILALWALALLTVFAVSIGMKVRQQVILVSRVEKRDQVYYAAQSGIKKAVALLKSQEAQPGSKVRLKTALLNNSSLFKEVAVGMSAFDVSYPSYDNGDPSARVYGIVDEERKININQADRSTLETLLKNVTDLDPADRQKLAGSIIDWREFGESETGDSASESYYEGLKFPYKEKKANFETLDELILLKGMTPAIFRQIAPFITVYGNGKVNINTAPRPVLIAVGMNAALADTLITLRQGPDNQDATRDDILFPPNSQLITFLANTIKLEREDLEAFVILFQQGKIGSESSSFMVQSRGYVNNRKEKKDIACVFNLNSGKIEYWREY